MSSEHAVGLEDLKEFNQKNLYGFGAAIAISKYNARIQGDMDLFWKVLMREVDHLRTVHNYAAILQVIREAREVIAEPDRSMELQYLEGVCLGHIGYYSDSQKAFEILAKCENTRFCFLGHTGLAWSHLLRFEEIGLLSHLDAAEFLCRQALHLDVEEELRSQAMQVLGSIYLNQKHFELALQIFLEVSKLYEEMNSGVLNNLAIVYICLKNLQQAGFYVEKAERMAIKRGEQDQEAMSNFIRGRIEEELVQDYTRAHEHYLVAYDKFVEAGSIKEPFVILQRITSVDQQIKRENMKILAGQLGVELGPVVATFTSRSQGIYLPLFPPATRQANTPLA